MVAVLTSAPVADAYLMLALLHRKIIRSMGVPKGRCFGLTAIL